MSGRLEHKVVFITGAARGQGRAHAVAMAREGADIVAVDICRPIEGVPYDLATPEDLAETRRLVMAEGRGCIAITGDARSSAEMREAAHRSVAEFGGLDVAVINHGIAKGATWETVTDDDFDMMIEVNLVSVWRAARAVIPHLVTRGGGSLLLTSSAAGRGPFHRLLSYVTAKHGVVGLARALAAELGGHGIRVNALCPGNVATQMLHNQHVLDMYAGGPGGTIDGARFPAEATNLLPVPWFEPEAVATAAVFLASDDGRYITGTDFAIDAGATNQPPGIPVVAATRLGELAYQVAQRSG